MKPSERIKVLGTSTHIDHNGDVVEKYDEARGIIRYLDEQWEAEPCPACIARQEKLYDPDAKCENH